MKSRAFCAALVLGVSVVLVGCSNIVEDPNRIEVGSIDLTDGVYEATFDTDSSMFHVNETCDGKGKLTVEGGQATIHITLISQNITNLFVGTAEDAQKDGATSLEPTVDTVTFRDGLSEEVFGFDVPVAALDEEFDLAILGKKGTWYDHKVRVSDPVFLYELGAENEKMTESDVTEDADADESDVTEDADADESNVTEDGIYMTKVVLEGGSGKATVASPCQVALKDGVYTATIIWSSSKYDFMMIGEEKYLPVNTEGNSTFEIPISVFDEPMDVQADTIAMSTPHLIDYTLTFDSGMVLAE